MLASLNSIPRVMISGLSGGSGKTIVSLGLSRAWSRQDRQVIPFKKGPDYIDAAWLSLASANSCFCLDPFFLSAEELKNHFIKSVMRERNQFEGIKQSIALIEGNRGLFDGKDVNGSCSSAMLAELLNCPVVVTINCAKITRTVAALVLGLTNFAPEISFAGVILNNVASERHANLVRQSVEKYTDVQVLGVLPRMAKNPIPERYMGLHLKKREFEEDILDNLADLLLENADVEKIFSIATKSPLLELEKSYTFDNLEKGGAKKSIQKSASFKGQEGINIGYIYDDAFWFYYRENLEALKELGANLIPISILDHKSFAKQLNGQNLDGLYIGGGFPELYAKEISKSKHLLEIKNFIENNLPVYAECGGFMVLSKCLNLMENEKKVSYEMANVFHVETEFFKRPQGLGYTKAKTCNENPYHPLGSV